MLRKASTVVVAVLTVVSVMAPTGRASGDDVRRRGPCSLTSEWRLIVRREDPTTLRVRFVIATETPGRTWSVFLSMNGSRLYSGYRTTDSNGHIRVTRFPSDAPGDDKVKGSANDLVTGESCAGSLTYPS